MLTSRTTLRLPVVLGIALLFSTLAPAQTNAQTFRECRGDDECPSNWHCASAPVDGAYVRICQPKPADTAMPVDLEPLKPPKYPCKTDSDCPLSTLCGGTSCYRDASRTFFCYVDSDCFDTEVCTNKQPGENAGRCYPRPDRAQQ